MTRAVKSLVDNGYIDEQADSTGTRGQPSRRLIFRTSSLLVLGLVLANERLVVTVEDLAGERLYKRDVSGDFHEPHRTLDEATAMITEAFAAVGATERFVGIGIAAQGFFIEKGRRVISIGNPLAWSRVDLKEYFERCFSLPVTIQNDAKAIAVGTIREGLARLHSHYFCFYLGGGVGGALVNNNELYEGVSANAGEIGNFVPRNEFRPTISNFLKVADLERVEDWSNVGNLPPSIADWCREAGASLTPAAQLAVRTYDVDRLFVCSYMPGPVLQAICSAIKVEPIGSNLLSAEDAHRLLQWPIVTPINDTSLNRGACALASYHFLRNPRNPQS